MKEDVLVEISKQFAIKIINLCENKRILFGWNCFLKQIKFKKFFIKS